MVKVARMRWMQHPVTRGGLRAVAAAVVCAMAVGGSASPAAAVSAEALRAGVSPGGELRIRNHRGGYLPQVVAAVEALNRDRISVRIDGGFCLSACTVFLALDRVCVAPWTQFGFHAPVDPASRQPLRGAAFESATTHVARYYTPALARWWMREGRYVQDGLRFRSGAELIAMGYRACPPERSG